MDTIFLSKVLGIYFIILAVSYLMNPRCGKKAVHQITNSYGFIVFLGSNGIIFGLLIILRHNLWTNFAEIAISAFGWLLFILGAIFIFFPKSTRNISKKIQKHENWIWLNLMFLILGIFLSYMGFFKK